MDVIGSIVEEAFKHLNSFRRVLSARVAEKPSDLSLNGDSKSEADHMYQSLQLCAYLIEQELPSAQTLRRDTFFIAYTECQTLEAGTRVGV